MPNLCPAGILDIPDDQFEEDPCLDCNLFPCSYYESMNDDDECQACSFDLDEKEE